MLARNLPYLFASSFFVVYLAYSIYYSSNSANSFPLIVLLIMVLFGILKNALNYDPKSFTTLEILNIISAHIVGGVATYTLVQNYHINSVVSASLIGLIGYYVSTILTKNSLIDLAPNIYCGTFVGMVAATLLGIHSLVAASFISGLLFVFLASRFNGHGGKLGSIAFMSCVITAGIIKLL